MPVTLDQAELAEIVKLMKELQARLASFEETLRARVAEQENGRG